MYLEDQNYRSALFYLYLWAEKKILFPFYNMSHIIIRAVAPVANENCFCIRNAHMTVYKLAKSSEFIFLMSRLYQCICINMPVQVIENIDMHAVEPGGRMAFRNIVFIQSKPGETGK